MQEETHVTLPAAAWTAALFLALSFLAFGLSLGHGFAMVDDPFLVVNNLAIRSITFSTLHTIFTTFDPELYIPLTFLTYQIDHLIGGGSPAAFHFTNVLLHGLNAWLVAWLLLLLTKRKSAALLGGVIFAVHPIHAEAVSWIAGRKDLLSAFFFLLSFCLHLRYREAGGGRRYALSLIFFLCSLLSKVMTLTLPVFLLFANILLERRVTKRMTLEIAPYALLSVLFGIIALFGKERVLSESTLWETGIMAMKSAAFYVYTFLVPADLTIFYVQDTPVTLGSPEFFLPALFVCTVSLAALLLMHRRSFLSFGWLLFLLSLSPTFLNFRKGGETYFASDRYAYLPSIGLIFLVLMIGLRLLERTSRERTRERMTRTFTVGAVLAVIVLMILSVRQTSLWGDHEALYAHALDLYPSSVPARVNLAVIYRETGRPQEELAVLKEGLEHGDDVQLLTGLGSAEARRGDAQEARKRYEHAMELDPDNPEPHFFLGSLYDDLGRTADAIREYERALELDPTYVAVYNNLGDIAFGRGENEKARGYFESAVELNPNFMEGFYNLSLVHEREGNFEEAFIAVERAYALDPEPVQVRLGIAPYLIEQERYALALEILRSVIRDDPNNTVARALLQDMIDEGIVGVEGQ